MYQNRRFNIDKNFRFIIAYFQVKEVEVLQEAGLPVDLFDRKTLSLSAEEYFRLWSAFLDKVSTEKPLPLMIESFPISGMSPPVMAAMCSPDFLTFAKRIQEYKPLIGPLVLKLTKADESFKVTVTSVDPELELHPVIIASEMVFFTKMMRDATGQRVVPLRVETTVPLNTEDYTEYFGVEPVLGTEEAVSFRFEDAKLPFVMNNEAAWEFFEPEMRKRLSELEMDASFAARVRAVLMELLPMGRTSINDASDKLCVSSRTLQRRLKAEQTSFQQQLNHSRELLARHYLSSSEMGIAEIAFLLGYEEPSSFSRAFTSWQGVSPDGFRMQCGA